MQNGGGVQAPPAEIFAGKAAAWDTVAEGLGLQPGNVASQPVPTPGVALPVTGDATYKGFVGLRFDPSTQITGPLAKEADLMGNARIKVDFSQQANAVSGTLSGFVDADGDARDGKIFLDPGQLLRTSANGALGTVSGSVTGADGRENRVVSGNYLGFIISSSQGFYGRGDAGVTGGDASAIDFYILADQ